MPVKKESAKGFQLLPALVLGGLFLTLAIGLALLSSGVYRQIVDGADRVSARRTALSYLVGQVRRADHADGIAYGDFGGNDALFLRENGYITILYQYDGMLRELYMEEDGGLTPADGMEVTPLSKLLVEAQDNTLSIAVTDGDGQEYAVSLTPRSGIQEEPS